MGETSQPDGRSRAAREGGAKVAVACLAVGSATAAACLGLNMVLLPLILGHPDQWIAPGDIWQSIRAARFVANGALLFIYGAPETMSHGGYQYPPVWPLLMAPAVGLGDALELVDNRVFRVPRPTMMIPMVIVAGTVTAAALAAAVWRFAQRFNLSGRWGTVAAVALATFMPMGVFFHGEDLLVVAFTLVAAAAYGTGAGWVAAGLLTKQTMIAFVPALLAACDQKDRRRFAAIALGIPAAAMLPFFVATPTDLLRAFRGPQSLVDAGAPAVWAPLVWDDAEDVPGSLSRMLWLAAACALTWLWRHRCRDPRGLLAVLTTVALIRTLLFEPVVYAYYWATPLAFTAVWATFDGRRRWTLVVGISAVYLWYLAPAPPWLWWGGMVVLAALVWGPVVRSLGRHAPVVPLRGSRANATDERQSHPPSPI